MFQTRAFDCHVKPQLTIEDAFKSETIWRFDSSVSDPDEKKSQLYSIYVGERC